MLVEKEKAVKWKQAQASQRQYKHVSTKKRNLTNILSNKFCEMCQRLALPLLNFVATNVTFRSGASLPLWPSSLNQSGDCEDYARVKEVCRHFLGYDDIMVPSLHVVLLLLWHQIFVVLRCFTMYQRIKSSNIGQVFRHSCSKQAIGTACKRSFVARNRGRECSLSTLDQHLHK